MQQMCLQPFPCFVWSAGCCVCGVGSAAVISQPTNQASRQRNQPNNNHPTIHACMHALCIHSPAHHTHSLLLLYHILPFSFPSFFFLSSFPYWVWAGRATAIHHPPMNTVQSRKKGADPDYGDRRREGRE